VPAIPLAYQFSGTCNPPSSTYRFDPAADEISLAEQGNLFTQLPTAIYNPGVPSTTSYVPVVQLVPVTVNPVLPCQGVKSPDTLKALDGKSISVGMPAGTYAAWAIIDPAAPVYRLLDGPMTSTGLGLQKWGWFNHFLLAYIDGGVVPVSTESVMEGMPPVANNVLRMRAQRLFYPRSPVMTGSMTAPGAIGRSYDVLEFARKDGGYSPVCQVFTYDAGGAKTPEQLPRNAATITDPMGPYNATLMAATPAFTYCLQGQ
jgi:hypothetical protein